MKTKSKKFFFLLMAIVLLASACVRDFKFNNLAFDSDKWKNADKRTKGQMVYDLKDRRLLIGKNKQQVVETLGAYEEANKNTWSYQVDVGIKFGNDVWSYRFNVFFDEQSQTVKGTTLTD
jgi:hypothetical protein